jgi:RNA polymerase sigma-70 factor (ECF subfamily)
MDFGKTLAMIEQNIPGVALATANEFVSSSENEFLERLKLGEASAFDELVARFSGDIYGLLWRITENKEEAKDLTQETFLRVVQSIKNFRGDASLKTWLFRIAINQARNRRRWWVTRRADVTFSLDTDDENAKPMFLGNTLRDNSNKSPEDDLLKREQSWQLRAALHELAPQFREAVILRDIEGMSYEDIAAALGTGIGTVKSRIARGRDELKKKLRRSL